MMSFCSRYWLTKTHVVGQAQLLDEGGQSVPVLLSPLLEQLGVRLPGDQVERFRMPGDDGRHRFDHVLEALAGPHETEGRHDLAVIEAELRLETAPSDRLDVGHPVRDHGRALRDAVHVPEDVDGGLGHHGQTVRGVGDRADRLADRG